MWELVKAGGWLMTMHM